MKSLANSKKFKIYKKAKREFHKLYPQAFPREGKRPTLKIGILKDIRDHGKISITMNECRRFLCIWTSSSAYLENMKAGNSRLSLDGIPHGVVTAEEQSEAKRKLKMRRMSKTLTSAPLTT